MEMVQPSPETKLDNMASEAKNLNTGQGFMQPGTTRKKGRPVGSTNKKPSPGGSGPSQETAGQMGEKPPPQVDPIAELMPLTTGLASFYSGFLVQLAEDQRAKLTKEKETVIAHTSAVCLNQYFPNALGKHAPAIVLGVTVLETSMAAIRLRKENLEKLREEKRRKMNGVNPESVN